jgi:hypothetical protein
MPKTTTRKKFLMQLDKLLKVRLQFSNIRSVLSINDSVEDELDKDLIELFILVASERYFLPRVLQTRDNDISQFLNKAECDFKFLFRVSKNVFLDVVNKIENHEVFNHSGHKTQRSVGFQQDERVAVGE